MSAKKWTLALALGLSLAACSSEDKPDEAAKTEEAKPEAKQEQLLSLSGESEIVVVMDQLAQRGGVELILEADVFGALSAAEIEKLNETYSAKQWREALDDLAKRAKRQLVEEEREGRTVLRITKS